MVGSELVVASLWLIVIVLVAASAVLCYLLVVASDVFYEVWVAVEFNNGNHGASC